MTRRQLLLLAFASFLLGPRLRAQDAPAQGAGGAISEEEFKALHELKQGAPPKLDGQAQRVGEDGCYLSLPRDAKPGLPALVVIHEWWGLNDNVKHWADRFAAEGYAALAVDLYGGTVATTPDAAMAAMKAVDPAVAVRKLKAAVEFLRTDPRVKATKVASIGWCFGGSMSLKLALNEPTLSAAVVYYGANPETDPKALAAIECPVVGVFGTRDKAIPQATVDALEKGLKEAGVTSEVHRFDADHAFANPSNPRYAAGPAAEAWAKVRAFLTRHLRS